MVAKMTIFVCHSSMPFHEALIIRIAELRRIGEETRAHGAPLSRKLAFTVNSEKTKRFCNEGEAGEFYGVALKVPKREIFVT
jgi:hypothetical protein